MSNGGWFAILASMDESKERHFDGKIALKAVIERDGKVLLVRDPREGKELWEVPGGRMNEGEDPKEALAREVKEELGVDIVVHDVLHMEQFYQFSEERNAFLIVYRATLSDPAAELVLAADEIAEVRWVTQAESATLTLFPEYARSLKAFYVSN